MFRHPLPAALIIGIVVTAPAFTQTLGLAGSCATTAEMQVYSNVFIHKETGDLLGYDLAVKRRGDSGADALLYVYEGGEAVDGIPLSGQISNNRLSAKGTWVEHLTEYPSKKDTVQKYSVEIVGSLDLAAFRGEITIAGMADHEQVRLRRVKQVWPCKNRNPHTSN